jgi:hypothetical protein
MPGPTNDLDSISDGTDICAPQTGALAFQAAVCLTITRSHRSPACLPRALHRTVVAAPEVADAGLDSTTTRRKHRRDYILRGQPGRLTAPAVGAFPKGDEDATPLDGDGSAWADAKLVAQACSSLDRW